MTEDQITKAINKAQRGIDKYIEIMGQFHSVNVANDRDFQRKFNGFYRISRRSEEWYKVYYHALEEAKSLRPSFDIILHYFWVALHRYEPSFSSKLVATVNPYLPVWDQFVIQNIGKYINIAAPSYASKNKVNQAITVYSQIQNWYRDFELTQEGQLMIHKFDELVGQHQLISNMKKLDFIFWQTRDE